MSSSKNNITSTCNQTSPNGQATSNNHTRTNNQNFVIEVSMEKPSFASQLSKVAKVPDSLASKIFEGNDPTPDLTTENIDKLESTLDYGIQRWMSQKKKEDGVTVYGT
ncbi:hypothetical protein BZA77DRAFT_346780 [Pyronema omphalodes]|nr:hypothetical protein BZA77DRAFT_346780 [Pyronema omphalodes]